MSLSGCVPAFSDRPAREVIPPGSTEPQDEEETPPSEVNEPSPDSPSINTPKPGQRVNMSCGNYAKSQASWTRVACQCDPSKSGCTVGSTSATACVVNGKTTGVQTDDCQACCDDPNGAGESLGNPPKAARSPETSGGRVRSFHGEFDIDAPSWFANDSPTARDALADWMKRTFAEARRLMPPGKQNQPPHFTVKVSDGGIGFTVYWSSKTIDAVWSAQNSLGLFVGFMAHEYGHLLVHQNLGGPISSKMDEGLSTYVATRWWGRADGNWQSYIKGVGTNLSVGNIFEGWSLGSPNNAQAAPHYQAMASFCDFLIRRKPIAGQPGGLQTFADFWVVGRGDYQRYYGTSFGQLQNEWSAWVTQ